LPTAPPGISRAPGDAPSPWLTSRRRLAELEGVVPALAGADADHVLDGEDRDLAVADRAGADGPLDGVDHRRREGVVHEHLDPHLRDHVHLVLRAAVGLRVARLPAEALRVDGGEA